MVFTLYKLDGSPPVRAVLMTIEAISVHDVEYIDVNLLEGDQLTEEYTKLNPQHTVPTLVEDDFVIWDSHAIATYLITVYGENDSLYPSDPIQRARIDQRLHFDSGILFPALLEAVGPVIYHGENAYKPEALQGIKQAYELMDKFLTTQWLAGDDMSVADICCVATISSMNEVLPIDEALFPNLANWLQRFTELEIYIKRNEPGLTMFKQLLHSKLA